MTAEAAEAPPTNGLSIRTLLLGDDQGDFSALQNALSGHGVLQTCGKALSGLTGEAAHAVEKELASVTANLTDIDLGDVLLGGWRLQQRVRQAAEATLAAAGSEELVQLGPHRITSIHEPTIDLHIDSALVHTFHVKLEIVIDIDTAVLVIRGGCLTDLRCGDVKIACTLTLDKAKLLHKERCLEQLPLLHFDTGSTLLTSPTEPPDDQGRAAADEPPRTRAPDL